MLLALDIGNSNTEIGLFSLKVREKLIANYRVRTDIKTTSDELGLLIKSLLLNSELMLIADSIKGVICSSVVPSVNYTIKEMAEKYFNQSPIFVSEQMTTGLTFKYPNPKEIGADRIVNAVAVNELYDVPAIIVDFGTATTFCALSSQSEYLGGVITPGIATSMETLTQKASKLPNIDLIKPESVLGKSTTHAMCSGIYLGAITSFEGIVQLLREELKFDDAKVVVTGGFSKMILSGTQIIDVFDPNLTLKGLEILYHKNNSMT